ncbi:NFU1 iron-sulfur cluster scaffold-like protein, mitochondrial [Neoconidiobolus thromboides FSU 785]|nr:NFU1 iron-sulfur cluster scaffold-like protein, mitochondrial [Neoconidiobolus thromboides FSU 785]
MFIQTENTPNPDSIKFVPGREVMGNNKSAEFTNAREGMSSPLAKKLFLIDGIQSIFFGPDFVTVNKNADANWPNLKPEIFATLMDFFSVEQPMMYEEHEVAQDTKIDPEDDEVVQMIKELLETRIRPSIQEDGGDIEYLGFENSIVKLKLRGACRTCESSEVTLKHGIQNMLMHYIPEVEGVEQIQDELDKVSSVAFDNFEETIRVRK